MEIEARPATAEDIAALVAMYRDLEDEQGALRPLWPVADGLDEPVSQSFQHAIENPETLVLVGTIDDVPLGFLLARPQPLLSQGGGEEVGTVQLIHTDAAARGVGVGATMMEAAMLWMRGLGLRLFDAIVSPGHRAAKNFFEAQGFSARLIVMHHADDADA